MRYFRPVASVTASLLLVGMLSSCTPVTTKGESSAQPEGTKSLTLLISGDTNIQDLWEKGIIPAYKKEHPGISVKTNIDLHGEHDQQTLAKLATATKAGNPPGFDLVDAGFVAAAAADGKLLTPISKDNVKGLSQVPADIVKAGKGYGIPYRASSVLLAYDTKKVSSPPKTLQELLTWIKENPGKFAYNSPSTGGSGAAFVNSVLDSFLTEAEQKSLQTKVDKDAEAKWDKGFTLLHDLGASVFQKGVYPNGNNQVLGMLGSGQISMAPVWSDQFITAQKNGLIPDTVGFTQISQPSFTGSASYLGIPATTANKDAAIDLLNFVLSPKGQTIIAEQISGYPVISLDTLPKDVADKLKKAHPEQLRPGYYSDVSTEMANQWDQRVP